MDGGRRVMIEEEARSKACPFGNTFNASATIGADANEEERRLKIPCCIASACMAWRWVREDYESSPKVWVTAYSTTNGYCGLAGTPQ
jgi:hypothetical protein